MKRGNENSYSSALKKNWDPERKKIKPCLLHPAPLRSNAFPAAIYTVNAFENNTK